MVVLAGAGQVVVLGRALAGAGGWGFVPRVRAVAAWPWSEVGSTIALSWSCWRVLVALACFCAQKHAIVAKTRQLDGLRRALS